MAKPAPPVPPALASDRAPYASKPPAPSKAQNPSQAAGGQKASGAAGGSATGSAQPQAIPATESNPATNAKKLGPSDAERTLDVAREQFNSKLYPQTVESVGAFMAKYPDSAFAPEALMLKADACVQQDRIEDAMAAFVELRTRYKDSPRVPEASLRLAQLTLLTKQKTKDEDARKVLAELVERFPASPWSLRGLVEKAAIEDRRNVTEKDPTLDAVVPAALVTYRTLVARFPEEPAAGKALGKLAGLYEDIRRYDLAAECWIDLATRNPNSQSEAWFKAGELFEKKVKDKERAKDAYSKVPHASPDYATAQKRLAKLG